MSDAEEAVSGRSPMNAEDIATELDPIARRGLPVTSATAGDRLPRLPNVLAYSSQPESRTSRVRALNDVLKEILDNADHEYAEAARNLFALDAELSGTTLGYRDKRAAEALTVSPGHFRQRVRSDVVLAVADDLRAHASRYQNPVRSPRAQKITGRRPEVTEDSFTEEQELTSRIWARLYGWRAETIAAVRVADVPDRQDEFETHAIAALHEYALLHEAKTRWIDRYGAERINAGTDRYDIEGIIRLTGWSHLPEEDTAYLRLVAARVTGTGSSAFGAGLRRSSKGQELVRRWQEELRGLASGQGEEDSG